VATYEKMLKMCIPVEAVRHKMKQDQADVKIIEAVFGKGSGDDNNNAPVSSTNKLSKEEEEIAAKYRHMLKMHIPKEAVEHKMAKEGISQKIMSTVLDDCVAIPAPIPAGFKANTKKDLTADELSVASQFKKMLKLQIPRDKVLERMQQENIDDKIVAFVLGKSAQALIGDENSKTTNKNSSKLVSLHWTPLSGKELDNSVWKAAGNRKVSTAEPEGNDISKLVELFQKKTSKAAKKEKKAATNSDPSEKAKLLDLNRSNNIAISLKAFKDFEFAELAEVIMHLDPMRKIQGERVHFLRDLLPTQTEIKIIKSYDGSPSRLVPAELWFQSIADIKRIEVKVQVLRTMEMLKVEAKSIGENLRLLTLVCNQVMDSEKLQDLLGMVLRIGNIMNEGTRTGGAAGFKFDSLLKLTQTKSSDGKTTVLDYLVTVFVAKNKRETLDLTSEFPECQTASRMLVSDLVAEVRSIQDSLEQCKEELAALEDDAIGRSAVRFTSLQAKASDLSSSQSSTVSDSRAGLLAAIQRRPSIVDIPLRDVVSDPSCRNIELPVNAEALLSDSANEKPTNASSVADLLKSATSQMVQASQGCSRRRLSAMNGNSGVFGAISRIESVSKNNVHAAVARLRDFIMESDVLVEKLVAEKDETMAASRELARYCGESAGHGATSILLGILSGFASSLEEALKKHDQKRLAEEKRKKRREEERSAAQTKGPQNAVVESVDSSESDETGASLVLMVNQMLKDANPRTKEDFKNGRVTPNPSQTLQKIYETEQKVIGNKAHNRKLDLVSAIKERSDEVDQGEVQIARSKFGSPLGTEDVGDTNMFRENKGSSSNRVRPRPENAEHRNLGHPENQPQRNAPLERPNPKPEGHRQKPSPDGYQRKQSPPIPEMSRPATNKPSEPPPPSDTPSEPPPPSDTPSEPPPPSATNRSANSPPEETVPTTTYKTLRERIKSFASRNAADASHQEAGVDKGSSPPAAKEVENSQGETGVEEKSLSVSDEKTEESAKVDVPETLDETKVQYAQLDNPQYAQLDNPQFDISGSSHRLSLNGIATPERQIPQALNTIQRLEQSRVASEVKIVGLAASMSSYDKDPDLTIASPPRIPSTAKSDNPKSLRELAMEKRQQRHSLGKDAKQGEDQATSIDSKGESTELSAVNASGESTVARMARIKREEKVQQKHQSLAAPSSTTTHSTTVQPVPTTNTSRGQSLVKGLVQMAREKREAKKNTPT
jgi:Formin Homology 2 Domain/Subunit CCDC53 of WASH complex